MFWGKYMIIRYLNPYRDHERRPPGGFTRVTSTDYHAQSGMDTQHVPKIGLTSAPIKWSTVEGIGAL